MSSTVHLRNQPHPGFAAHIERADALGAVGLVRGQAHQIDRPGLQVDGHLAGSLRRIDVENDAALAANATDFRNVLDHADFVVHQHDRNQNGVGTQGIDKTVQVEQAIGLHVEIGGLEAAAFHFAHRVEHRLVLGLDGDDVLALALVELGGALDGQIVGFGCTGRPDDFLGVGVDQRGDLLARLFHRSLGLPAPGMAA
ncbi:hypothetical protein GALL_430540 [mine drainage metagenome]|uniref:Uncharacterized protein n=1 Tax=mine drainage metagenome TaxID=410659 RepID=A0A1J5PWK4_9ZZZZ